MRDVTAVLVAVTCILASCASGMLPAGAGGGRNEITAEALDEIRVAVHDAYRAVEHLRPNWLRSRGATVHELIAAVVYVNGRRFGELESLRRIPVADVREMRFISARDATTRYGTGHAGGVIAVTIGRLRPESDERSPGYAS